MSRRPIVEVDWTDPTELGGWQDKESSVARLTKPDAMSCRVVGYLVEDLDDRLILAGSENADSWGDLLAIPKANVLRKRLLK